MKQLTGAVIVVCLAATAGCNRGGPNKFTESYVRDIKHGDVETRREAARNLAVRRAPSDPYYAIPALIDGLNDTDPEVAATSHLSLQTLTGRTDIPQSAKAWNSYWKREKAVFEAPDEEDKISELQRQKAEIANSMGIEMLRQMDYLNALPQFKKAVVMDPQPVYQSNLARCYLSLHRYRDAIVSAMDAIEKDPSFAQAWFNLGDAYRLMEDADWSYEAVDAYEEALALDTAGTDWQTRWSLARLYLARATMMAGDNYYFLASEYIEDAFEAAALAGGGAMEMHITAALIYYGLGQYFKAYQEIEIVQDRGYRLADTAFLERLYPKLREMGFDPGDIPYPEEQSRTESEEQIPPALHMPEL